jgi:hypothetical protein
MKQVKYYNHIELYNPIISEFFEEFSHGKIYRVSLTSEFVDNDIELMANAQEMIEAFESEMDDDDNVSIESIMNPAFFPAADHLKMMVKMF